MKTLLILTYIVIASGGITYAHQGHHHHEEVPLTHSEEEVRATKLKIIGDSYRARVKPIFQKSCFDCHSNQAAYPWYYKIPGAKQLIDSDIKESKEHIDLSNDFPFKGHGTPDEDLKAIVDEVEKNDMPPFRYRIMHPSNKLSDQDKKTIINWATEGIAILKEKNHEN